MITFNKRRLAALASTSAIVAIASVAAVPAMTLAAAPACTPTGLVRDGIDLTAARMGGTVTGPVDAAGCNIGVYIDGANPGTVTTADISGANYFGVVVNGTAANVTRSEIHLIGEVPLDGTQHGNGVLYINGATGTISGNTVEDFQKNGIIVSGQDAAGTGLSAARTSATVVGNTVTGQGHISYIAQNGVVVRDGASALVKGNLITGLYYTPDTNEAVGVLDWNAESVTLTGNTFAGVEQTTYGDVTVISDAIAVRNVHGTFTTTVRPHRVRIDFRSEAQPANTTIGSRLHWVVKVDGRVTVNMRQGFGDHDIYNRYFATGKHRVVIYKNGVVAKSFIVKA